MPKIKSLYKMNLYGSKKEKVSKWFAYSMIIFVLLAVTGVFGTLLIAAGKDRANPVKVSSLEVPEKIFSGNGVCKVTKWDNSKIILNCVHIDDLGEYKCFHTIYNYDSISSASHCERNFGVHNE